ncbi:MAG TPA: DUF169 domain-containing protein [Candidatus Acidoferrales bacterium]|jgi:uncharacterized protein (DUF169 family)
MNKYSGIEAKISKSLGLKKRPVAVKFMDTPPNGVPKFEGAEPSSCSFWRIAASGRTFYTVPSDHYNCAVGSHTHNIPLPPERAKELEQVLSFMTSIGYVKMEEIPDIPQLAKTPRAVVYSPLGETPVDPDAVIFAGPAAQIMVLQEAAHRAGHTAQFPMLGRPTCMAIPAAMAKGAITSSGCIGNRVYTDLADSELYAMVPGKDVERVADEIETVASANAKLREYHQSRRQGISTR